MATRAPSHKAPSSTRITPPTSTPSLNPLNSRSGPNPTSGPYAPQLTPPSDDDMALVNQCLQLFYTARSHRRPLVQTWLKNYRVLRNRTWSNTRAPWLPSPEVPEIYPILASVVGWMTDQRPTLDVIPSSEPHSPYHNFYSTLAHDLQQVLQTCWYVHNYEAEVEQVVWDGLTYGTGIFKACWDAALVGGLGDITLRRIDPFTFYPDPQATSMIDANYFIEARTMSLQEMDRRWPGSAKRVNTNVIHDVDRAPSTLNETSSQIPLANPGAMQGATSSSYGLVGQSRMAASPTDDPGVTVLECWLREHSVTQDDDGNDIVHDSWRVVILAGNHILMDEKAEDLWGHGSHPYDRFVPHRNGEFWGFSMVEWLTPSQIAINRLLASLQHNVELTGNPVFKETSRAGITRTKITNKPGQRLEMKEGGVAEWMQPPAIAPQFAELIRFYIEEMERISGLSAISRGMAPGGRNAASVVESIQESSFVRIRLALRNLEWALCSSGQKLASMVCENYTTPRIIAITGPQSEASSRALNGHHFYLPSPEGRIPMRFQLMIQAGSSLATSRHSRIAEADTLFAMGAIDEYALLEAHNYPNHQAIAKRVMELKAQGWEPPGARQRSRRSS